MMSPLSDGGSVFGCPWRHLHPWRCGGEGSTCCLIYQHRDDRRERWADQRYGRYCWIGSARLWSSSIVIKHPILQKVWKVITWRWRLQLAINAPFGLLWVADKTNPAVHAFDMSVLTALHAEWLAPMMGIA